MYPCFSKLWVLPPTLFGKFSFCNNTVERENGQRGHPKTTLTKGGTLEYQINVGYQINVALGILVKINKRRVSNKRSLGNFYENQ